MLIENKKIFFRQHGAQNQTYNDIKIGDIVQTKILQVKNLGLDVVLGSFKGL